MFNFLIWFVSINIFLVLPYSPPEQTAYLSKISEPSLTGNRILNMDFSDDGHMVATSGFNIVILKFLGDDQPIMYEAQQIITETFEVIRAFIDTDNFLLSYCTKESRQSFYENLTGQYEFHNVQLNAYLIVYPEQILCHSNDTRVSGYKHEDEVGSYYFSDFDPYYPQYDVFSLNFIYDRITDFVILQRNQNVFSEYYPTYLVVTYQYTYTLRDFLKFVPRMLYSNRQPKGSHKKVQANHNGSHYVITSAQEQSAYFYYMETISVHHLLEIKLFTKPILYSQFSKDDRFYYLCLEGIIFVYFVENSNFQYIAEIDISFDECQTDYTIGVMPHTQNIALACQGDIYIMETTEWTMSEKYAPNRTININYQGLTLTPEEIVKVAMFPSSSLLIILIVIIKGNLIIFLKIIWDNTKKNDENESINKEKEGEVHQEKQKQKEKVDIGSRQMQAQSKDEMMQNNKKGEIQGNKEKQKKYFGNKEKDKEKEKGKSIKK